MTIAPTNFGRYAVLHTTTKEADMTINIDGQRAVDLLRQVIPVNGEDYIYDSDAQGGECVYTTHDRHPSCIVGYALLEAGVPLETLYAIDHNNHDLLIDPETDEKAALCDTGIDGVEVPAYLAQEGVELTEDAAAILGAAQRAQDNGESWGRALWYAEHIAL